MINLSILSAIFIFFLKEAKSGLTAHYKFNNFRDPFAIIDSSINERHGINKGVT